MAISFKQSQWGVLPVHTATEYVVTFPPNELAPIFAPYNNREVYSGRRNYPLTNPQTPIRKALRFP